MPAWQLCLNYALLTAGLEVQGSLFHKGGQYSNPAMFTLFLLLYSFFIQVTRLAVQMHEMGI